MTKVKGVKVKAKKVRVSNPLFLDEKYTGGEPMWDFDRALEFTEEEFDHHLRASMNYYNYYFNQKDLRKHVVAWLQENTKFNAKQISAYMSTPETETPMTVCSLIRAAQAGMPMKEKHREYIIQTAKRLVASTGVSPEPEAEPKKGRKKVAEAPAEPAEKPNRAKKVEGPSIQDRLNAKADEVIAELEGAVDDVFLNKKGAPVKVYELLTTRNLPQAKVGRVREVFQRQIAEITEALAGTDEQLTEGYSHLTKADVKRIGDFYVALLADLDAYVNVKKATKATRVKRPVSKDKVVSRLKYMKESKELRLVSINPVDILSATSLWVYNTKTRKLYCYQADALSGSLGVKGASLIGYDALKSVGKTLRKPDDVLKELMKAGKVQLRKFLDNIKAVEVKGNGRLNADCLILRAV